MRQLITLLLLATTLSISAQHNNGNGWSWRSEKVKGNGEITTESRDLSGFDGISVCCSINVEISQGEFAVKVAAESNLQEYIRTEVSGDRLEIGFKRNTNISAREQITVYVTLPALEYLGASSSSNIVGKTTFAGDELDLDASSSGSIDLDFRGDHLYTDASSSGKIVVRGTARKVKAKASSGARIDVGELDAKIADANVSSGARAIVSASEELEADASSGGSVRYNGNPSTVDSDTSSGGSVRRN